MAAHTGDVEIDVTFDPERIARDLGTSLAGALSEIAGRLLSNAYHETGEDRPTDPQIVDWPSRTQPPTLIVRCPMCDDSVQTTPLSWEIVIDPTSTIDAVSVRGLVQHTHDDDQTDVRWPFAAVWTPPPVTIADVQRTFARDEVADDLEEGAERTGNGERWEFTPDSDGALSLSSAVFQALGGASTCWEAIEHAGVFDSTRAKEIGDALLAYIEERAS